jgi:formate-dependent phosphoribosylglycinamide formyltransferase (GAR transformylase)
VGKDALPLMTQKTAKLLANTKQQRPCVCKTTHSMGGKGIFVIHNDEDEAEFNQFLQDAGTPTYVITEYIEIERNVACHFFIHPNGEVTWIGSNENLKRADGSFSSDSYLIMKDQEYLREIQTPFVRDVVQYCQSLGYWGLCGVDVLFDKSGKGYLVDLNPRVTGSCPALMVLQMLQEQQSYAVGLFRRTGDVWYSGNAAELFAEVEEYNIANEGKSRVILFSTYQVDESHTKVNIGVYSNSVEESRSTLNHFAKPKPEGM